MKTKQPLPEVEDQFGRIMPLGSYGHSSNSAAVAHKVRQDILFLLDRIERIKNLQTPNSSVLNTYQAMLESRQAVLHWLEENMEADNQGLAEVPRAC